MSYNEYEKMMKKEAAIRKIETNEPEREEIDRIYSKNEKELFEAPSQMWWKKNAGSMQTSSIHHTMNNVPLYY